MGPCPPVERSDPGCARCINWKTHTKISKPPAPSGKNQFGSKSKPGCPNGFEEGLKIEAILGARDSNEGIFYLVKWMERDDPELIPALLTFIHAPDLVIHFYANRISWITSSDSCS